MLLSRHQFHGLADEVRTLRMYADASPSSGVEVFAVLVDLCVGDTMSFYTMPSTVLGHGYTSTVDKMMALCWTIWLVCGPSVKELERFCSDIRSFTADFGVESGLADVANVLDDFAHGIKQQCSPQWQLHDYIFPNCVFIVDWDHLFDAILRNSLNDYPKWPSILDKLRALCNFFGNNDYRLTCRLHARRSGTLDYDKVLDRWSASFAKWRYRTVRTVVEQVVKLRRFCQEMFQTQIMGDVKDQSTLQTVGDICNDVFFWKWVSAFRQLACKFDNLRSWGSGCACHAEELKRGRRVICGKLGRRLHEAPSYVKSSCDDIGEYLTSLTLDAVEGDHEVHEAMDFIGRRWIGECSVKTGWLQECPYLYANVSSPSVARQI
eukprot:9499194-Pyramimonas_sp.AAC.1